MIATLNGHDNVVRVLLKHCDPTLQIELKGKVFLRVIHNCLIKVE